MELRDEISDVSESVNVIMYTPMTIMPSLTNLSMVSFTIPPPIRNTPVIKNPREFRVWAARRPVKSVLNVRIMVPIHTNKIPSKIAAMIRFFENRNRNT